MPTKSSLIVTIFGHGSCLGWDSPEADSEKWMSANNLLGR